MRRKPIELTNSSGPNHSLNDHEDVGQYGPYAIPSEIMPRDSHPASLQSYPKSLVNHNEIPIELSRQRTHLALVMFLMGMKMLTNRSHLQYHPG